MCIQVTTLPNDGLGCDIVTTFLTQGETASLSKLAGIRFMLIHLAFLLSVAGEDFRQQSVNVTVKNTAEIGSVFCTEMRIDDIVLDDAIVENEQAFRIELQSTSPTVSIGPTKSFNITIRDNDGMWPMTHIIYFMAHLLNRCPSEFPPAAVHSDRVSGKQ